MEKVKAQLDSLFCAAGKHYEALTYINYRDPQGARFDENTKDLVTLHNLLEALAPFKEQLHDL